MKARSILVALAVAFLARSASAQLRGPDFVAASAMTVGISLDLYSTVRCADYCREVGPAFRMFGTPQRPFGLIVANVATVAAITWAGSELRAHKATRKFWWVPALAMLTASVYSYHHNMGVKP